METSGTKQTKTVRLTFYECEHMGDLRNYVVDVASCGAQIVKSRVDSFVEEGYLEVEVADVAKFIEELD